MGLRERSIGAPEQWEALFGLIVSVERPLKTWAHRPHIWPRHDEQSGLGILGSADEGPMGGNCSHGTQGAQHWRS